MAASPPMATAPEAAPARNPWPARLPSALFVASVGLLAWRITRGVDFSDEAYYAIFLDEWLKEGIARSPFLILHQTSALLTYPFALAYHAVVGSTAGLLLFLRCLYLAGATLSALVLVRCLRDVWGEPPRWLVGALLVVFVPYNLPAPSYNTMGLQALLVACSAFACAVLAAERGARSFAWLVVSAAAWAVAVMAYPPLLLPLGALGLGMLLVLRPSRRFMVRYAILVGACQALTWSVVLAVFGARRIADSVTYQSGLAASRPLGAVFSNVGQLLAHNPWFAAILVIAVLVGLLRSRLPAWAIAATEAACFVALLLLPPALFHVSHGIVLAAALGGIALLADLRPGATLAARLLSLLYATSWIASLAMAGTAALGLLKIPVGALLAAAIAVAAAAKRGSAAGRPRLAALPAFVLWGALAAGMFDTYYAEPPGLRPQARWRIDRGIYAGLAAAANDFRLWRTAEDVLRKHERPGDTLTVLGRYPGLCLLGQAPIRALVPYSLAEPSQAAATRTTYRYYAAPENRPSLVLVHHDPGFPIISPFAPDFDNWYALVDARPTPLGRLEIFRRKDQVR
jgi:hypothetical protein